MKGIQIKLKVAYLYWQKILNFMNYLHMLVFDKRCFTFRT